MDKDVLVRFIQFLEVTFGRINSKRLMTLYGFLLFLLYSKEMTVEAVWYGTCLTALVELLFWWDSVKRKGSDSIEVKP